MSLSHRDPPRWKTKKVGKSTNQVQETGITARLHPKDEAVNDLGADTTVQGGNDVFKI